MDVGSDPADTHLVDVLQPHIQVLGDVLVGPTRNVTEFVVLIVDCDGIGVANKENLTLLQTLLQTHWMERYQKTTSQSQSNWRKMISTSQSLARKL